MDLLTGVSDRDALMLLIGYLCACSGRGSLVDGLLRRRAGGVHVGRDG